MTCWTVARYITAAPRAAIHHTAHIAHRVWRGKGAIAAIHHHAYLPTPVAAGVWKLSVVCTVAGGVAGAVGGAHWFGVPFPPVTPHQLVDALCCGQSPLTHVSGPPGTWASGVTGGLAGYPDRPGVERYRNSDNGPTRIPEPSGLLLLATGVVAIRFVRRK